MKVKVLRALPSVPMPTAPPVEAETVTVEPESLVVEPTIGRLAFADLRALTATTLEDGSVVVLLLPEHQPPVFVSSRAGIEPRRLVAHLIRACPSAMLGRAAYRWLRGEVPPRAQDLGTLAGRLYAAVEAASTPPSTTLPEAEPAPGPPCPHCGSPRPDEAEKCPRCGVVFEKWHRLRDGSRPPEADLASDRPSTGSPFPEPAPAEPPVPTSSTADEAEDTGLQGLPGIPLDEASAWGRTALDADSIARWAVGVFGLAPWTLVALAAGPVLVGAAAIAALAAWLDGFAAVAGIATIAVATASFVSLAIAIHTHGLVSGARPSFGDSLALAVRRAPTTLLHRLGATIHCVLGLAALVLPGVVFGTRYALLEVLYACDDPRGGPVSKGQVSRNLVDDFGWTVFGHLWWVDTVTFAAITAPAYLVGLGIALGRWSAPTWMLGSTGLFLLPVAAIWVGAALVGRSMARYVLFRELDDLQGDAAWTSRSSLSGWTKVTLGIDLVLLLLILVRASESS